MDFMLQSKVWNELVGKLGRLPHALLLHGPAGVGKLALAERFARLLLCERRGEGAAPCERCDACRWFVAGSHPDVRYVEPEALARYSPGEEDDDGEEEPRPKSKPSTEIKVEQIRALADFIYVGSHRAGSRVAILHPAEAMNATAANALLKSLEEPPAAAVFLLVSHRPAGLLATVRSRCVAVPVPIPEAGAASAWLAQQGVRGAARWLAFAGGAPRRALEYATGERGAAVERMLRALAAGEAAALGAVQEREDLELLAEILQKLALDRAFSALAGQAKYSLGPGGAAGDARAWLAYARAMGQDRQLARHPLNPRLFACALLAGMPR